MSDDLVKRLRERAADDRKIQANNEAVATALRGQRLLFDQGIRSDANTYAVRVGLNYQNCAKNDAKLAADWEQAADAVEQLTAEHEDTFVRGFCAGQQALKDVGKLVVIDSPELVTLKADNARLREALDCLLTSVEHADFEDGWCCCGDDMLHHQSPMDCGHTPVDMGEYHASLAIKKARAALKGESHE